MTIGINGVGKEEGVGVVCVSVKEIEVGYLRHMLV